MVFATIIFAVAYTTNSTISFLMDTVSCNDSDSDCSDMQRLIYFSVTIFFNMISLIAAILVLLSVLAKLRRPISCGSRSGHNNVIQQMEVTLSNPGEEEKEKDAKRGEEHPPAYGTLVPLP